MRKKILILIIGLKMLVFCNCFAQAVSDEQHFLDWTVYKVQRGRAVVCYMISLPIDKKTINDNHLLNKKKSKTELLPYFMVANIEGSPDEISVYSGFDYKDNSLVKVSFAARDFYLFSYVDFAWADNRNQDGEIIKELQKNDEMIIVSSSNHGYDTINTYSLIGFSSAYRKMKELCYNG